MVSAKHNSLSWPMLHLWHLYGTLDFFNHRHMNLAKIINEIILQLVFNKPTFESTKKGHPKMDDFWNFLKMVPHPTVNAVFFVQVTATFG